MRMLPKEDVKWYELFFDIIFVVGLSDVLTELSHNLYDLNLLNGIFALAMILILFNIWIKVVMLENKVKVIERHIEKSIAGNKYIIPIFIQFFLTLLLIHFYSIDYQVDFQLFLSVYILITLSNILLYTFHPVKIIYLITCLIVSFYNVLIADVLFTGYVIFETFYTYFNIGNISNSIFKKSFIRPTIYEDVEDEKQCRALYERDRNKLYFPHIIERLGIIMIVFLAEYVIISMGVIGDINGLRPFIFQTSLLFSFVLLFYYNYFSAIEHIDAKLFLKDNRREKYLIGKRTIYIISLYFLSITSFALYTKNLHTDFMQVQYEIIGLCGLISFGVADVLIFTIYEDFKDSKKGLYMLIKLSTIIIAVFMLLVFGSINFLIGINIFFVINIIIGKKLTTIDYSIK